MVSESISLKALSGRHPFPLGPAPGGQAGEGRAGAEDGEGSVLISAEAEMSFQLQFLKNASVFLLGFSVIHFCSHLALCLFT